jgi:serine/threonine-protein kinase
MKGKPRNVREAARQLEADYILEGSVLPGTQELRVNAQLVRAHDDFPVWSGRYERALADVFVVQDEISRGIVNNLRLKLGGGRRRYEISAEAYDLYLRARAFQIRLGARGFARSIGPLEQVIAKDPSFAPAYASLATSYAIRSIQFAADHHPDELAKMKAAAEKATQLDPLLAEAHEALALVYARDGQWEQSEKSFSRAIELDPNRSSTYANFATWVLWAQGRTEEALRQLRVAERVDPLSPEVHNSLTLVLVSTGRYDEAAAHCAKISADKDKCLARVRLGQGRIGDAIPLLANLPTLARDFDGRGLLGYAYARSGHSDEAEKMLAVSDHPNEQALIFAGLGDKDRTLEALEQMTVLGPQRVGMYLNSPELALLRGDPRLKTFRKKVGLPE